MGLEKRECQEKCGAKRLLLSLKKAVQAQHTQSLNGEKRNKFL